MLTFQSALLSSPLGEMIVVTDDDGALRALEWTDLQARMDTLMARQYKTQQIDIKRGNVPICVLDALSQYFNGHLTALDKLVTVAGGTQFQRSVWAALRDIPVGQTRSYKDIAIAIGNPKGVRAIGLANGANPIGIVVPCHRVIGSNGTMTGYGGGLGRKEWLLRHEGAIARELI
jgi:methylated-DNA-[protein]-cysteine S-methyltransferase